jgi:2-polyprenyl-3-methyl-5-hydroxy-6-metoxy-1,4-benzoquinol methylase
LTDKAASVDDWDAHWDTFGDTLYRNPANQYRLQLIRRSLGSSLPPGSRLLDIGCGQGELVEALMPVYPGVEFRGTDYAQTGVERAKRLVVDAAFFQRDLLISEPVPTEMQGWASHAICTEVIEHVDDPTLLLSNARDYLAKDCSLVVTVPAGPMSAFDHYIGHRRHFTPKLLGNVLENAGYRVHGIERAGFPGFNLYRLVVLARGPKLVALAKQEHGAPQRGPMNAALKSFDYIFKLNLPSTPWGWQLVARASVI